MDEKPCVDVDCPPLEEHRIGLRGPIEGQTYEPPIIVEDPDPPSPPGPGRAEQRAKRKTSHRIPAVEGLDVVACLDRDAEGNIITRHGWDGYSTTKTQPWIKKAQNRKKAKAARSSRRAHRRG